MFTRGPDGNMDQRTYINNAWGVSPFTFHCAIVGGPCAVSGEINHSNIVTRGIDNHLWHNWWDGSRFSKKLRTR